SLNHGQCAGASAEVVNGLQQAFGHVIDGTGAIDSSDNAAVNVGLDQVCGLLVIELQAVFDDFFAIIGAAFGRRTCQQTFENLFVGHFEDQDRGQSLIFFLQDFF